MNLEEVKKHFKDAKVVECLSDGKRYEIGVLIKEIRGYNSEGSFFTNASYVIHDSSLFAYCYTTSKSSTCFVVIALCLSVVERLIRVAIGTRF